MQKNTKTPNSPESIFSHWLEMQSNYFQNTWHKDEDIFGSILFKHIMWFASQYNKTFEMYEWLKSKECFKLFNKPHHQPATKMIFNQLHALDDLIECQSSYDHLSEQERVVAIIAESFMEKGNLDVELTLDD